MHEQISPRRACNPCGYTMKMSSRYNRLLIYGVKRTTKTDGMGPFNVMCDYVGSIPVYYQGNPHKVKLTQGHTPSV